MASSKRKLNNNRSGGLNFDKRFDQFFEAGRQIADGFSGTRPGTRRNSSLRDFSRRNVRNVSNWVTDKMDSFFEDDFEEWSNDDDIDTKEFKSFKRSGDAEEDFLDKGKRPLEAISLRSRDKLIDQQKKLVPSKDYSDEDWEEDSFYQINQWHRPSNKREDALFDQESDNERISTSRNFPRSRRNKL
tara:strand:- start:66 stop:626 length:561 start_codon:yes stop_codon:yes gene_type:complete